MRRLLIVLLIIGVPASYQSVQAQSHPQNKQPPEFCFISEDQIDTDSICLPIMEDITPPDPIEEYKLTLPCSQSANPGGASCDCKALRIFHSDIVIEKELAAANYKVNMPLASYYVTKSVDASRLISYYGFILEEYGSSFGEAQIVSVRRLLRTADEWHERIPRRFNEPRDTWLDLANTALNYAYSLLQRMPCPIDSVVASLRQAMHNLTLFTGELAIFYAQLFRAHHALKHCIGHINQIPAVLRAR